MPRALVASTGAVDLEVITSIVSTLGICMEKCRLYEEATKAQQLEEEVQKLHIEEAAQNHLLEQMLPKHIIDTLKQDGRTSTQAIGSTHEEVFVLFSDIESFTPMASPAPHAQDLLARTERACAACQGKGCMAHCF